MQFDAVCCSVLQCGAVCCSVVQCIAVCCSVLQCVAVCCSVLQCVAVSCSVLQCVAVCWKMSCVSVCVSTSMMPCVNMCVVSYTYTSVYMYIYMQMNICVRHMKETLSLVCQGTMVPWHTFWNGTFLSIFLAHFLTFFEWYPGTFFWNACVRACAATLKSEHVRAVNIRICIYIYVYAYRHICVNTCIHMYAGVLIYSLRMCIYIHICLYM